MPERALAARERRGAEDGGDGGHGLLPHGAHLVQRPLEEHGEAVGAPRDLGRPGRVVALRHVEVRRRAAFGGEDGGKERGHLRAGLVSTRR